MELSHVNSGGKSGPKDLSPENHLAGPWKERKAPGILFLWEDRWPTLHGPTSAQSQYLFMAHVIPQTWNMPWTLFPCTNLVKPPLSERPPQPFPTPPTHILL